MPQAVGKSAAVAEAADAMTKAADAVTRIAKVAGG
jgi:hypothetical protein